MYWPDDQCFYFATIVGVEKRAAANASPGDPPTSHLHVHYEDGVREWVNPAVDRVHWVEFRGVEGVVPVEAPKSEAEALPPVLQGAMEPSAPVAAEPLAAEPAAAQQAPAEPVATPSTTADVRSGSAACFPCMLHIASLVLSLMMRYGLSICACINHPPTGAFASGGGVWTHAGHL